MPITIDGDGTITGLSVGGLPDGVVDADMLAANAVTTAKISNGQITTAKISDDQITTAKISDSQVTNAKLASSGGLAKAWVNCVHDGTVTDSFNVSSVTDNGSGDLTVNFTSSLANANYCMTGGAIYSNGGPHDAFGMPTVLEGDGSGNPNTKTTSACRVKTMHAQRSSNSLNVIQQVNTQLQIYMVFHGD